MISPFIIFFLTVSGQAATKTVCPSGCAYDSIQAAINAANPGDTIMVKSGVYKENVEVNKPRLTLIGSDTGGGMPVVDANKNSDAISLSANGTTLRGFMAVNAPSGIPEFAGIKVISNNNAISRNNASNNQVGIFLWNSGSNTTLSGNNAYYNNRWGILLVNSSNTTLSRNNANNNTEIGIILYGSSNNTLSRNNASNNNLWGILPVNSRNNIIFMNNFINNYKGVSSHSQNFLNSPNQITYQHAGQTFTNYLGNYWSDYRGTDSNADGIGDTPYTLSPDSDNYPLMTRFQDYIRPVRPIPQMKHQNYDNIKAGEQSAISLGTGKATDKVIIAAN